MWPTDFHRFQGSGAGSYLNCALIAHLSVQKYHAAKQSARATHGKEIPLDANDFRDSSETLKNCMYQGHMSLKSQVALIGKGQRTSAAGKAGGRAEATNCAITSVTPP